MPDNFLIENSVSIFLGISGFIGITFAQFYQLKRSVEISHQNEKTLEKVVDKVDHVANRVSINETLTKENAKKIDKLSSKVYN